MNRIAFTVPALCLLMAVCAPSVRALPSDFFEPASADGLEAKADASNIILTCPTARPSLAERSMTG